MHQLTNYVYIIIIQSVSEPMHVVIIMIERQQSLTHTQMHFILIIHRIEYVCAWIKWENTEKKMKKIAYKNWLDFETMWHLTDEPFIYTFFHSTVGSLHIFVFPLHLTFVWHLRRKYCNIIQPLNEIRKKKIVPAWSTETFHCARIQSLIALQRINILYIDRWQTRGTRRSTIVTPKHINNTECNWIASVATHACIFKSDTLITYIDEWFMDPRLICAYYIYRKKGRF